MTLLLLFFAAGLVTRTQECAQAAREALALCIETVIPSLFPFMVLSSLWVGCGQAAAAGQHLSGLMRPLFGLSGAGAGALMLGLVGGYPVGARTAAELVRDGAADASEGERLLAFCNNAGPGFILGVCGGAVFQSARAGVWLYLVHVFAALLTGMLLRADDTAPTRRAQTERRRETPLQALPAAMRGAVAGMGNVCGYVVVFRVLLRLTAGLTDTLPALARAALSGALELTSGVLALPNTHGGFVLCAVMLGWGGLSVHAQSRAMLEGSGLRGVYLLRGKLLHALLSAAAAAVVAPWAMG